MAMADEIITAPETATTGEPELADAEGEDGDVDAEDTDAEPDADDPATDPKVTKLRRDLRRQRDLRRSAEAERDAVTADRDAMAALVKRWQHEQVVQLANDELRDGNDLFAAGVEVADLLTEDGLVDPAKVDKAAQAVGRARPHWSRYPPSRTTDHHKPVPRLRGGGDPYRDETPSWSGVLRRN